MEIAILPDADLDAIVIALVLVTARFAAFFAASPLFSRTAMTRSIRLGIALAMAMMCAPMVAAGIAAQDNPPDILVYLVIKEFVFGFFLGTVLWLPVRGLELAGVIIDTQRGSTQAQDFDVVFTTQTTPTAILLAQIFAGYFFSSGAFLLVLNMLFDSVSIWSPADPFPRFTDNALPLMIRFAGNLFFAALSVVLPILGFMFLADIVIAFLARSAPSLNALTFGMPVKSAVALIMLIVYLNIIYPKMIETLEHGLEMISQVLIT